MARPKGKLFALLAVFVAIGLATATGAFTTVQADRTATVSVAGDQSALLAITEVSNAQQDFVEYSGGEIQFKINNINTDATTNLSFVFEITNNGEDPVPVTIDDTSLYNTAGNADDGSVVFYTGNDNSSIESSSQSAGVDLGPGDSVKVGIKLVVPDGVNPGSAGGSTTWLDGSITITAGETADTTTS